MNKEQNEKFLARIFANKGSGHVYRQCLEIIQTAINKGNQKIEIKIVECEGFDSSKLNDLESAATDVTQSKTFEETERSMKKLRQVLRNFRGVHER